MKEIVYILTIYDTNPNFGNRLQNYAVTEILHRLNFSPVTIEFEYEDLLFKLKLVVHNFTGYRFAKNPMQKKAYYRRKKMFDKFNRQYISHIRISGIKDLSKLGSHYFILGSDQVWNPYLYEWSRKRPEIYAMDYVLPRKRIVWAPSFGIEQMPIEWIPYFKKVLNNFKNLSVRENEGANIIKSISGRNAEVLIDPTLMLDKEQWATLERIPEKIDCKSPYILTYILGEESKKMRKDLQDYSFKYNLSVIEINSIKDIDAYGIGPCEFLYLISHAELILTDSFHGSVFSFLYEKPFLVYERQKSQIGNMMSRITTLLSTFHMERKYVNSGLKNELMEHDYLEGFMQLKIERQKVLNFLKSCMNVKE